MRLLLILALAAHAGFWNRVADPLKPAREHFEAGRYRETIAALSPQELQKLRRSLQPKAYAMLGESYERLGDAEQALSIYQLSTKIFPQDLKLTTRLARLLHASGLEEQALPLYEKVLVAEPGDTWANLGLAQIDHALGFLDRSALRYELALEGELKDHAGIWRDYAEVLLGRRDFATAEAASRRSLQLLPTAEARVTLALALRGRGLLEDALAELEPLQAPEHRRMKALWLLEAGRPAEADAIAAGLLAGDAADSLAHFVRGRAHLAAGRRDAAKTEFLLAAKQGKNGKTAPFVAAVSARLAAALEKP